MPSPRQPAIVGVYLTQQARTLPGRSSQELVIEAVKGAMMSSADPSGVGEFDPMRGGAGMVSAEGAVTAQACFATADGRNSLSFGFRQLTGSYLAARSITINNTTGGFVTAWLNYWVYDSTGTQRCSGSIARGAAPATCAVFPTVAA